MKKLFIVAFALFALSACNNGKDQEKALQDEVIKIHDKVMGADNQLMDNKMKIDTLLTTVTDTTKKAELTRLQNQLTTAEEAMENWMQNFDPEQANKSSDEKVAYLTDQKKQIMTIDSLMNVAIDKSTQYLNTIKK
jgi:predicted transcriptional regulator of viral defense system